MFPLSDDHPTERWPIVTYALIALNLGLFVWQTQAGVDETIFLYGFTPAELHARETSGFVHLFTSMFLHGGWLHVLGNMWYLHIFGDNVEDEMGRVKFLVFYLLGGLLASLAHFVSGMESVLPCVGASGAVSAVLGAYMIKKPTAQIKVFTGFYMGMITEMPAIIVLFFWIGFQVLTAFASAGGIEGGGVAYWAHIGGFAVGALYALFFEKTERRWGQGEW